MKTQRKPNKLNQVLHIFPNAVLVLPFHEVSIQFLHISWLNRWFVFWFRIVSWMFMFRQSGAQVRWRWMAALIPVNILGVNAWPFSVFTTAKNFRRISLQSVGLTVLRSTESFLFSHHLLNFFIPHSVDLLVFFTWAFCPIYPLARCLEKCWKLGTSLIFK